MTKRLEKLLRPVNRQKHVIEKCLEWVEKIVNDENRCLASIYSAYFILVLFGT